MITIEKNHIKTTMQISKTPSTRYKEILEYAIQSYGYLLNNGKYSGTEFSETIKKSYSMEEKRNKYIAELFYLLDQPDFLEMSFPMFSGLSEYTLIREIVNQGIDSRLEGFTKSIFEPEGNRLFVLIEYSEITTFLWRLSEIVDRKENNKLYKIADQLEENILYVFYGIED